MIILTVSNGPEIIYSIVPNLYNLSEDDAKLSLRNAGLELGKITTAEHDTVPKGYVISQTIPANSQLEKGKTIDIVISLGKPEEPVPEEPAPGEGEVAPEEPSVDETPTQVTKSYILAAPRDTSKEEYHVVITFESDQGGSYTVFEKQVKKEQFPLPIEVTGSGKGQLKVYFDTVEEYNDPIDFNEVTQ